MKALIRLVYLLFGICKFVYVALSVDERLGVDGLALNTVALDTDELFVVVLVEVDIENRLS